MITHNGTEIELAYVEIGSLPHLQLDWMPLSILVPLRELSEEKAIELATVAESMFKSISHRPYLVIMLYQDQNSKDNEWEDNRSVCVISENEVADGELASIFSEFPEYRHKYSNKEFPELMTWHFCKNPKVELTDLQKAEVRIKELEAQILEAQIKGHVTSDPLRSRVPYAEIGKKLLAAGESDEVD